MGAIVDSSRLRLLWRRSLEKLPNMYYEEQKEGHEELRKALGKVFPLSSGAHLPASRSCDTAGRHHDDLLT